VRLRPTLYGGAGALKRSLPNLYGNFVKKLVFKRKNVVSSVPLTSWAGPIFRFNC